MMQNEQSNQKAMPGAFTRSDDSGPIPPTSKAEMDAAVADLQAHKVLWTTLAVSERIAILDQILDDLHGVGEEWVSASIQAKGIQGNEFAESEEWALLAYVYRCVRLFGNSLRDIQRVGRPQIPGAFEKMPDGRVRAQVFPVDRFDSMVFSGMTAEIWMEHGTAIEEVKENQARFYSGDTAEGSVVTILGAGNGSMLIPTDFMSKLFIEGSVVILKMNPVNAYLGPIIAKGFRALIERNFMRVVYGGAEEGNYLCHHPGVDELHMTGSDKTYDAIVFGPGEEGARRKAERQPLIEKLFTCELGNVTPVIVVPGPWSQEEIEDWGEKLTRWLVINAGFNCLTPRVIIQSAAWEKRQSLNEAIGQVLAKVQTRKAYYPGAEQRHNEFLTDHPTCQQYGAFENGELPWTFIQDVDASSTDDVCFKNEAFCGLFAETAVEGEDVPSFLATAVAFANEHLWGNLTATLIVHPESLKDAKIASAVDQAVADLHYGTVLINQFAGLGFFAMTTPWGAFPGNDIYDIQSGIGFTCNTLMFENPQKVVVRNPFKVSPDPLSLDSRTVLDVAKRLADLQYKPSWGKVPGMLWSAIRS